MGTSSVPGVPGNRVPDPSTVSRTPDRISRSPLPDRIHSSRAHPVVAGIQSSGDRYRGSSNIRVRAPISRQDGVGCLVRGRARLLAAPVKSCGVSYLPTIGYVFVVFVLPRRPAVGLVSDPICPVAVPASGFSSPGSWCLLSLEILTYGFWDALSPRASRSTSLRGVLGRKSGSPAPLSGLVWQRDLFHRHLQPRYTRARLCQSCRIIGSDSLSPNGLKCRDHRVWSLRLRSSPVVHFGHRLSSLAPYERRGQRTHLGGVLSGYEILFKDLL